MIALLAQITPDQIHPLVQVIIGGSAAIFLLNQAITFWKEHMREQPSPANTYATKEELRQAHGRMNREKEERDEEIGLIRTEIAGIRKQTIDNHEAGEARATKIHDRINALVVDNATMPLRVVTLLRETKGLIDS